MALSIIIGILGLGFVVFFHEAGHFMAAKLFGVKVETFSIGWGKKLFSFKKGDTEYCISLLPLGGYCKMQGEETLSDNGDGEENAVLSEEEKKGSLSSAPPYKKAIIYFAGPFMNLLFSIIVLSVIWFSGFSIMSPENRIILASEYLETDETFPADKAGLKTGDIITEAGGNKIENYQDMREKISFSAGKPIALKVLRENREIDIEITPELNKSTGAGKIGVYPWIDPVVEKVKEGSSAFIAGLKKGDVITKAGGREISNTMELISLLNGKPEKIDITFLREGREYKSDMILNYKEDEPADPGLAFAVKKYDSPKLNIAQAFAKGTAESFKTLFLSIKSLKLLFSGIDLSQAVSGPIRITYMMGEVTSEGFKISMSEGIINFFKFISLISIALFFMNLLPIPALDGGQIFFCLIEMIFRKKFKPKVALRYQIIGFSILITLMIFTVFNDVKFLIRN